MYRYLMSALLTVLVRPAMASVCSTIANGIFTDQAIWSCGCDPSACDTLVIDHEVSHAGDLVINAGYVLVGTNGTLSVSGKLDIASDLQCDGVINAPEMLTHIIDQARCNGSIFTDVFRVENADTLFNSGSIIANDSLLLGEYSIVYNNGIFSVGHCEAVLLYNFESFNFQNGMRVRNIVNYGIVNGTGALETFGSFFNEPGASIHTDSLFIFFNEALIHGTITTDSTLYIGNEFIGGSMRLYPDGAAICRKDFYNYGTISGGGSICIGRHSENHATLQGSFDICDATPTLTVAPYLDVNEGTFTPGVNYCEDDLCATIMGVDEQQAFQGVQVAPNPANDRCTVRLPQGLAIASYEVYSTNGRMVAQRTGTWMYELELEAPASGAGVYSIVLHGQGGAKTTRSIVFLP